MKIWRRYFNFALALALVAVTIAPRAAAQQDAAKTPGAAAAVASDSSDLQARLAAIERAVEERRRELGIPGVSLAIVKDDRVIYLKGLGVKDFARQLPVTPDTLFAIGSSSKAFTAMSVVMSADEGKLSLEDAPRKFLPYFKLRDAEADAKITIRDLLSHRSGLNRTDLPWATGRLSREEVIQVAALAKPTAKLGEKFQYQNVMFVAAGAIVERVQGTSWERFVAERIFNPLGMRSSNISIREMQRARDYSLGYDFNSTTKETRLLPMRDLTRIAPAGGINSNARDMAQWVRLMLGGGAFEGRRLVSEKSFNEMVSKQMTIGGKTSYGLGWFLREWQGRKVVEHGGNIDGFNALVALMPEERLGVVMLSNVTASPLGETVMRSVWTNLASKGTSAPPTPAPSQTAAQKETTSPAAASSSEAATISDPQTEAGKYNFAAAGFDIEIVLKDGKLVMSVPGQPEYTLERVSGRRYKLTGAPEGFFVTFRPAKDNPKETEVYLEQPQGNYVLPRAKASDAAAMAKAAAPAPAEYTGPHKDLLGTYENEKNKAAKIEVVVKDGGAALVVAGQPAYPLSETGEKDVLRSKLLPDTYSVKVVRDAGGAVSGLVLRQPEGEFAFRRVAKFVAPVSVEELLAKVIAAAGGEANWRRYQSMTAEFDADFESQGMTGKGRNVARAPNATATTITLLALGKEVGTLHEYFDGTRGGSETSFTPPEVLTGKQLEAVRISADFYGPLNWKTHYKTIEIKDVTKVGDEEAYVVVKTPEKGDPVTDYISTKTFMVLRRDSFHSSDTSGISLPVTEKFSDYRTVGGLVLPFKIVNSSPSMGEAVYTVREIKLDVKVSDEAFRPQQKRKAG
jgi:CubicO group peptidase (beta-lactamase class C family)